MAVSLLAVGYEGPPALTASRVFLSWRVDPFAAAVVLVLGGAYLLGLLRVARKGKRWPVRRSVAFGGGLVVYVVVAMSFLGVYSPVLFWVRATQNIVTLMIVPLLLALGAPLSLTLAAVGDSVAARLRRTGRATAARVLTFPLVVTALLIVPLLVLYLSPLYELTLRNALVDGLVRLAILGCGFVYFWSRLGLDPTPRDDPHLASFAISLTDAVVDASLGLVLWFGPLVAAGYYEALGRPWAGPVAGPDHRCRSGLDRGRSRRAPVRDRALRALDGRRPAGRAAHRPGTRPSAGCSACRRPKLCGTLVGVRSAARRAVQAAVTGTGGLCPTPTRGRAGQSS